jgi:esterase/lipase superfamily enzyme
MNEQLEQLALLDGLLTNLVAIRARMGPTSAAWDEEFAKIAARLSAANSPSDIARALNDLFELVKGTPAYDYVQQLLRRSEIPTVRVRGVASPPTEETLQLQDTVTMTGQALGMAAAAENDPKLVPVFFATNRKGDEAQVPENWFSGEPADAITYGLARVTIPVARHKRGKLETPAWWKLFADEKDTSRYVVLKSVEPLKSAEFCTQLGRAVKAVEGGSVLVFLHGYNVTFEEAALRAAQFSYDTQFRGALVLFSWPSLGTTAGYFADEERASVSAAHFVEFLRILQGGPWEQVHLVAHSMGNRVVLLGLADNPPPALPFGQVVFVAADVYVDVFDQKFPRMSGVGKLKSSYASKADRALLLSSLLHHANRVGIVRGEPITRKGMETIDASTVDTSLLSLGHGYFAGERTVVEDLGHLLRHGLPAAQRALEQPQGKDYWQFSR